MKRAVIGCVVGLGFVLGSAISAQAGEYNGSTGAPVPGPLVAHSVCAYSGLDLPDSIENNPPGYNDDYYTGGHVQSYGMYVRAGAKALFPSPGVACRGNATGVTG